MAYMPCYRFQVLYEGQVPAHRFGRWLPQSIAYSSSLKIMPIHLAMVFRSCYIGVLMWSSFVVGIHPLAFFDLDDI